MYKSFIEVYVKEEDFMEYANKLGYEKLMECSLHKTEDYNVKISIVTNRVKVTGFGEDKKLRLAMYK